MPRTAKDICPFRHECSLEKLRVLVFEAGKIGDPILSSSPMVSGIRSAFGRLYYFPIEGRVIFKRVFLQLF